MEVYYNGSRALAYFEKAKAALKNLEVQAKADFMISRQQSWSYALTPDEQAKLDAMEWN